VDTVQDGGTNRLFVSAKLDSVGDEVIAKSHVDDTNTTSTPLGASATYTGTWHECSSYSTLALTLIADQYSAINGVRLQFAQTASDTTLTREVKTTVVPNTEGIFFAIPVEDKYYRVIYTNGVTAQTVFRLTAQLKVDNVGLSAVPLISTIDDLTSVPIVRSVLTGKSFVSGLFENITTEDGRLRTQAVNVPESLSESFQEYAKNGSSIELAVDGDPTPVEFTIFADATNDLQIDFLTFQAFDAGTKVDKFLGMNQELTTGVIVEIRSEDKVSQFLPIKNTTEFNSIFSLGSGGSFDLVAASGNDSMVSTFSPNSPFILKAQGTYATDDYVKVIISDDVSSISRLRFIAGGRVAW